MWPVKMKIFTTWPFTEKIFKFLGRYWFFQKPSGKKGYLEQCHCGAVGRGLVMTLVLWSRVSIVWLRTIMGCELG